MTNAPLTWTRGDAFRRTLGYYALFICLGLSVAILGPTLPSLAAQTHTPLANMGLVFLCGSASYSLGTIVSGRVLDRVRGHPVLGAAQMTVAVLFLLIPSVPLFGLLLALIVCKGFAEGFINNGAILLLVWTHGKKVSPFMNGLHFFFGLGAFVAPFLVAQGAGVVTGYHWVYRALAVFMLLVGLGMMVLPGSPHAAHTDENGREKAAPARTWYPLVLAAALFLFFYVGAEMTFGGWVYTYAISMGLAGAVGAAYLTSVFWLAFTLGRLVSIPAATRFQPRQILPLALAGCLSLLALGIFLPGSRTVLWLMAAGLGFCMGPIWPTGFTLASQSIEMTGRISGMILLGDSFGGMVLPWLVGKVIGAAGPRAMIFLIFGSLLLTILAVGAILRLRRGRAQTAA
jgi:FHS family Na+ dependent glucose MFS transporter 1